MTGKHHTQPDTEELIPDQPETSPAEQSVDEGEYQEKWQRALADLENMRKRHALEQVNARLFGLEGFIEELLPVVDNFYRATEHIPAEQQKTPWVIGIQYIQKNLLDVLEQHGVQELPVKPGDPFDPSKHEALATEISDEVEDGHIISITNRGYMLHDRVLRPAQVTVSAAASKE